MCINLPWTKTLPGRRIYRAVKNFTIELIRRDKKFIENVDPPTNSPLSILSDDISQSFNETYRHERIFHTMAEFIVIILSEHIGFQKYMLS